MKTQWVVAKYMPDLRRREPVNVGVILSVGNMVLHRFVGERSDGAIDGRSARAWVGSTANYKRWVEFWRHEFTREGGFDLGALLTRRGDDSYYLEVGGERLVGTEIEDPASFLEQLYGTLVEPIPPSKQLDVSQLSTRIFTRLAIADHIEEAFTFTVPLPNGASDRVRFDYRYDNGQPNLFQRVSLTFEDDRSWHFVHAASWAFVRSSERFGSGVQHIALVRPRPDDENLEEQLQVLEQYANVVDVTREGDAESHLRELLHLREDPTLPTTGPSTRAVTSPVKELGRGSAGQDLPG